MTLDDPKETAQLQLIELLLERSALPKGSQVLDGGCGIGGTTRYLAKNYDSEVTGVTISGRQVEISRKLTLDESQTPESVVPADGTMKFRDLGSVRFIELDAKKMWGGGFTESPNEKEI